MGIKVGRNVSRWVRTVSGTTALAVLSLRGSTAQAAVRTWNGNTDANLATVANWSGAVVAGDSMTFGAAGSSGTTLNNDLATGLSIAGLTFNAGSPAYTIGGNAITLSGNVANNGTSLQTLNFPFSAAASRKFTTTTGGGDFALGGTISGFGDIEKAGTGTLTLTGANLYEGRTTLTAGTLLLGGAGTLGVPWWSPVTLTAGTLDLGGTSQTIGDLAWNGGSIVNGALSCASLSIGGSRTLSGVGATVDSATGITINGGTLTLDYTATNADRLGDSVPVTLTRGGALVVTANTSSDTSETLGELTLDAGNSTITIGSAASRVTTLTAPSFARANNGTALVRGTYLEQTQGSNVSRLLLADGGASLGMVGSTSLNDGANNDATQALKIVPHLIGDNSVGNTGKNFLTYDATRGMRVITAAEQVTLSAGYTTAANPDNARSFNGTITTANPTLNSLLFTGTHALNGTGTLAVNSGAVALIANNTASIGSGFSDLTLGNGEGIVTVTQNTLTINTPVNVTDGGGLTKAGSNTLVLGGENLYTGPTVVNQGTLRLGTGTAGGLAAGSGPVTVASGSTLALNLADGATLGNDITNNGSISKTLTANANAISGNISGSGSVTMGIAGGTLTLSGANTYSGSTTVSAGTLKLLPGSSLGTGYLLTVSGTASLDLGGNTVTAGAPWPNDGSALTSSSATAIHNTGATKATFNFQDNGASIVGGFAGLLDVNLTNSGNNDFNVSGPFANTGNVTFNATGANPIRISGSLNNTGYFTNASSVSQPTYVTGVIGANVLGVTENGVGTLSLANANLYTGTTTATAGTLLLDFSAATAPSSDIVKNTSPLVLGGGTLQVRGSNTVARSQTFASLTLSDNTSSGLTVTKNGGTSMALAFANTAWNRGGHSGLLVDLSSGEPLAGPTSPALVDGVFPWMAVKDVTATGFGSLDGGNNLVRYTGATVLTDAATSDTTHYKLAANLTLTSANGTSRPMNGLEIGTGASGTLTVNTGVTASPAAVMSAASFTIAGSGQFGASDANLPVFVAASNLKISAPVSGGAGSLTKLGPGTLILTGTKTFTGDTVIAGGTLQLGENSGSNGGNLSSANILNNGTLSVQGGPSRTLAGNISGTGGITRGTSFAYVLTLSGDNTYQGLTYLDQSHIRVTSNTALGATATGTTVNDGRILGLDGTTENGNLMIAEPLTIAGNGTANIPAEWPGNLGALRNIGGDNTLTGPVVLSGGTGIHCVQGSLTFTGGITGNQNLTVEGAGDILVDTPIATGTGKLTKNGSGTLLLNRVNTYTGVTLVNEGALGGTGTVASASTFLAGGKLSPGTSTTGTLTFGSSLNLSNAVASVGSKALVFHLGSPSASDHVVLTTTVPNALSIGSGLLDFADFDFVAVDGFGAGTYTLFDTGSTINGTLSSEVTGKVASHDATLELIGQDIVLTVRSDALASMILIR